MSLNLKVTHAGRAALVNASNTGTAPVTITEIGLSESAVVPAASATTLPGEFKRIAGVAGDVVAADTIHVNVTDGNADTYALRAFALYLDDGTLFAIYGQTDPFLEKTAQSIAAISIDAIFADIDAALLTFGDTNFLNPPATTDRQGVVELTTSQEATEGADSIRAVTAKALKDAVAAWLDARFGANNAGIWHPGNDGAGSGLDADLLDGKHAAAFLLAANYNAADILAKLLSVDGAGSGLDADRLDGQHGSYFLPAGSYTAADVLAKLRGVDGSGSGLDADTLDGLHASHFLPASSYSAADVLAKLRAVDGSGSGVDADLLDGLQASDFLRKISGSSGANDHLRLSNGWIIQWVNVYCTASGRSNFTWPIAFPNGILAAVPGGRAGLSYSGSYSAYCAAITNTGGGVYGNNGGGSSSTVCVIGIGY